MPKTIVHLRSTLLLGVIAVTLASGCKDTRQPAIKEDIKITDSLDIFEKPIIPKTTSIPGQQVVATVNGSPILQGQLEREASSIAVRLRNQMPPERIAQEKDKILNQALNNLITQHLLRSSIESEEVKVNADDVSDAVTNIRENLPEDVSFEDFLKRSGLDAASLKENIRTELRVQALVKQKVGTVPPPSDEKVAEFYETNKERFALPERVQADHILVSVPKDADFATTQERTTLASTLQKAVAGGKSVSDVLADYPESEMVRGGPVTFARGQIDKKLEEVLFAMQPNQTSEVSNSPLGLHVFYAKELLPAGTLGLDEVRDSIINGLTQRETQTRMNQYLQDLRSQAEIDVKL